MRFRYASHLVPKSIQCHLDRAINVPAYLCYLDISTPRAETSFVPVRRAIIRNVQSKGSSYILYMEAKEFLAPGAHDKIRALCSEGIPEWEPLSAETPAGTVSGSWVSGLSDDLDPSYIVHATDLSAFEETVSQLLQHDDFRTPENRFFYHLLGVRKIRSKNRLCDDRVEFSDIGFRLRSFQRYQVEVYHYFPDEGGHLDRPTNWLGIASSGNGVEIDGRAVQRADSEYDIKSFQIRGTRLSVGTHDELEIFRTTDPRDPTAARADIHIPVYAGPSTPVLVLQILVVGFLFALPAVISGLPDETPVVLADVFTWKNLVIYVAAVVATGVAVLGLKRPI